MNPQDFLPVAFFSQHPLTASRGTVRRTVPVTLVTYILIISGIVPGRGISAFRAFCCAAGPRVLPAQTLNTRRPGDVSCPATRFCAWRQNLMRVSLRLDSVSHRLELAPVDCDRTSGSQNPTAEKNACPWPIAWMPCAVLRNQHE